MATSAPADTQPIEQLASAWAPLRAPLVVCGVGFGGFFDGIVFHQILQLHHLLSNAGNDRIGLDVHPVTTVAGLESNTLWDGLFHAATYLALLVGVSWLWARWRELPPVRPPWRVLFGGLLVGWGLFNVVEGIVNHHILAIHHVIEGEDELLFDVFFLAAGATMIVFGARLVRVGSEPQGAS